MLSPDVDEVRALTVRQPWAGLIASGHKLVDNRSGMTHYRGPLAIHAGVTFSEQGGSDPRVRKAMKRRPLAADYTDGELGHLIALVDLVDCHPAAQVPGVATCCAPWGDREYSYGRRTSVAFHLVLAHPRPIDPAIKMRGQQGLWRLPGAVLIQLERAA